MIRAGAAQFLSFDCIGSWGPPVIHAQNDATASAARVAELETEVQRYRSAFNAISQGVAFFDPEQRLMLANRRYAEIYRLSPDQLRPGATLREIVELRAAEGTCPMGVDDYLAYIAAISAKGQARDWSVMLRDGRTIRAHYHPTPDGGSVATHDDITESQERRLLIEERVSLQSLIDVVPDNLWVKDAESRFVVANRATALRLGLASPQELIGKSDLQLCPWETAQKYLEDERIVIETGRPLIDGDEYILSSDHEKLWVATTKAPLRNERSEVVGIIGVSRDVTRRRLADALREGQAEILEMIATGAPVDCVLEALVNLIESQSHGILGSVLLISEDGSSLRHGAAPSLPPEYARAVDGLRIGPDVACSGSAAYWRELIVAADIASDTRWTDYRDMANALGLRSCWSAPILSKSGDNLGVFAIYATSAHEPTEAELQLTYVATRMASIAIERERAEGRPLVHRSGNIAA